MNTPWKIWGIYLGALLVLTACVKDKEEEVFVNEEFDYYFQRFETAAAERGLELDIEDLTAHISIIQEANVAGVCETAETGERTIRVDNVYWNNADEWEREFVIFHELGHCVLGRGHTDTQDTNGDCVSIMQSGLSGCRMPYNAQNREEYLDELFQ